LKRAIPILNSFLWPVLAVFLIEHPYLVLPQSGPRPWFHPGLIGLLVITFLKSFVVAGAAGCLVELLSGEEMTIGLKKFRDNIASFWAMYFVLALVPVAFSAVISLLHPDNGSFQRDILSFSEPVILFGLAGVIILTKYVQPLGLARERTAIEPRQLTVFLLVYGLAMVSAFFAGTLDYLHGPWTALLSLVNVYSRFVLFVLFAQTLLDQYPELKNRFTSARGLFLINPAFSAPPQSFSSLLTRSYPAAFAALQALTPSRYKIREFNRVLWRERYYQSDVLVALTCYTANCAEAYKIAKEFRKRGSTVIMGGPHVSCLPEEALEFCDAVVVGQVEDVWEQLVQDYEAGRLQKKYLSSDTLDVSGRVQDHLLHCPPEVLKDLLETTRGCRFQCDFCANPSLGSLKCKKSAEVVALVQKIKGHCLEFEFLDVNIYADPVYAKELFRALIPLKVRWRASASIDIAQDDEALSLLKASGCSMLLIGYEVFENSTEKVQGGKFSLAGRYRELSQKLKKASIAIKAHFIFGFPADNWWTILRLWAFCFRLFPAMTAMSLLTPFPGSPFFKDMLVHDRLINLNWRNYNGQTLVFDHKFAKNFLFLNGFLVVSLGFLLTTSLFGAVCLAAASLLAVLSFLPIW